MYRKYQLEEMRRALPFHDPIKAWPYHPYPDMQRNADHAEATGYLLFKGKYVSLGCVFDYVFGPRP